MKKENSGFSLIELLAVIFIISLLFGVSFYYVNNVINSSRDRANKLSKSSIEKSASLYVQEYSDKVVWENNKTCVSIDDLVKTGYVKERQKDSLLNENIFSVNLFKNNGVISSEVSDMDCNGRKSVPVPTSKEYCNDLEYNTKNQTLVKPASENFTWVTSSSTATNAGSYEVKAQLNNQEDYVWRDGTSGTKTITCVIKKAVPILTLKPNGQKNDKVGSSNTVTVNSDGVQGKLSVKSSNANYVIGKINKDNNLVVTTLASRKDIITYLYVTLTPTDTNNYYTTTAIYTIKNVELTPVDPPTNELCANGLTDDGGKELNLLKENLSVTGYNFVSGTRASGAGYHTIIVSLKYGYVWSDAKSEDEKFNKRSFTCYIKKKKIVSNLTITSIEGVEDKSHFKGSVSNGGSGTLVVSKSVTFTLKSDVDGTISAKSLASNVSIESISDSEDKKTHYVTVKGDKISNSNTIEFSLTPSNLDNYYSTDTQYHLKIMSGVTINIRKDTDFWNDSGIQVALYNDSSKKYSTTVTKGSAVTFFGVSNGDYDMHVSIDSNHKGTLEDYRKGYKEVTVNNSYISATVDYSTLTIKGKGENGITDTKVNGTSIANNGTITVANNWHTKLEARVDGNYNFQKWESSITTNNFGKSGKISTSNPASLGVWKAGTVMVSAKEKPYTIKYNSNGGTGTMKNKICDRNVNCTLDNNSFSKIGNSFSSWNTKADGSGKAYTNGASQKNFASAGGTINLYAIWRSNRVNIKYNVNHGILEPTANYSSTTPSGNIQQNNGNTTIHSVPYGGTLYKVANYYTTNWIKVSRTGYYVDEGKEWFLFRNPSKIFDQSKEDYYRASDFYDDFCDNSKEDCDAYLMVNWKPKKLTVNFHCNDGRNPHTYSQDFFYGAANNYFNSRCSYSGHTFDKWYENGSSNYYSYTSPVTDYWIDTKVGKNNKSNTIDLYARWNQNTTTTTTTDDRTITIKYDSNGTNLTKSGYRLENGYLAGGDLVTSLRPGQTLKLYHPEKYLTSNNSYAKIDPARAWFISGLSVTRWLDTPADVNTGKNYTFDFLASYACDFSKGSSCTITLCAFWTDNNQIMIGSSVEGNNVHVNIYSPKGMDGSVMNYIDYRLSEVHIGASVERFNDAIYTYNNAIPGIYKDQNSVLNHEMYLDDNIYNLSNNFKNCEYDGNNYYHCIENNTFDDHNTVGFNGQQQGVNAFYHTFNKNELFAKVGNTGTFAVCARLPGKKSYCGIFNSSNHPMEYKYINYR